jgi:hypothetical protein
MNRLDAKKPHEDGHWMDDVEIVYTFCCYDEAPACGNGGPRLPLPRTMRWETLMCAEARDEVAGALAKDQTIDLGTEQRLVRFPITLGHDAHGDACRYDDGVVLAIRVGGVVRVYPFRVVGIAPAVGVFVCTARQPIPELGVREEEPLFAAVANIVVLGQGGNWPGAPWAPSSDKLTWDQVAWITLPNTFTGPYPKGPTIPLVPISESHAFI